VDDKESESEAFGRGLRFAATALVVALVVTLGAQMPGGASPAWLTSQRHAYYVLWPQGWSFFAEAPRVDTIVAYSAVAGDKPPRPLSYRHMSSRNLWGVSRVAHAQVVEARQLIVQIPASGWRECGESSDGGADRVSVRVIRSAEVDVKCGA
jgi:antimicrobial peptide system SdpA family protein